MKSFFDFIIDCQERFNAFWDQFSLTEQMIISVTVLAILLAIAYYVVNWLRGLAYEDVENPDVFLTDFQQLKAEGKLSEEEFSKVKDSAIHATVDVLASVAPNVVSPEMVLETKAKEPSDAGLPNVTPSSSPPITLAEALARKKAETNNSGEEKSNPYAAD